MEILKDQYPEGKGSMGGDSYIALIEAMSPRDAAAMILNPDQGIVPQRADLIPSEALLDDE